jgi:Histidine kinase-, DNA gyrase B-, and HSP90-like ATPase
VAVGAHPRRVHRRRRPRRDRRRTGVAPEEVDLAALARETLVGLRASIEDAGAEIVIDPLPVVRADPRALGRVLQNLVSNAVKFAGDARPVVHVTARALDHGWEVAVIDNGVGVDPAERERIFTMFHRPGRDGVAGTGLGLAICERIVERHGGRIWVDAAAGGGSAFRFTLPQADAPRIVRPVPAAGAAAPRRRSPPASADAQRLDPDRRGHRRDRALELVCARPQPAEQRLDCPEPGPLHEALLVAHPLTPRAQARVRGVQRGGGEHPRARDGDAGPRVRRGEQQRDGRAALPARRRELRETRRERGRGSGAPATGAHVASSPTGRYVGAPTR